MNGMQGILMKTFVLLLLCWYQPVSGQTGRDGHIKTDKIVGYVFPEKQAVAKYIYEEARSRFTPTRQEVIDAEAIITRELKKMNDSVGLKVPDIGTIYRNLDGYVRQYVGFIDRTGAKVIWVNFVKAGRGYEERLEKYVIEVSDGGTSYWNVKVHLTEVGLFGLRINCRG
jgi:hypothetical protein